MVQVLAEGLVARGSHVTALVSNTVPRTGKEQLNGVRLVRVARLSELFSVPLCPSFPWHFDVDQCDVVHVHEPNPVADVSILVRQTDKPLVVSYHSDVIRQWWAKRAYYKVLDRVLSRADRIVVATEAHLQGSDVLKQYADKCEIIPYGIALDRLNLTEQALHRAQAVRDALGFDHLILAVGRLVGYKGFEHLIDALHDVPDAGLVIVGTGPLEHQLGRAAAAAGFGKRVQLTGEVDDARLLNYYHACDVVVLPSISRAEAFGLVQLEAMACGKPVVSTLLPSGAATVSVSRETGLCVRPGSAKALAAGLNELLRDDTLRRQLGENGKRRVAKYYSAERMVDGYLRLYERLGCSQLGAVAAAHAF